MVFKASSFDREELDDNVRGLVFGFNLLGIKTEASCEGHNTDWHYPFPWVCISEDCYEQAKNIIASYNATSPFEWIVTLHATSKEWIVRPRSIDRCLSDLHEEAFRLADFLFRRYKKERLA